ILARRYLLPAYKAARELADEVMDQCFAEAGNGTNEGRRAGLAARYVKDAYYRPGEAFADDVRALSEHGADELRPAIQELNRHLADLLVFVFHVNTCGISPSEALYEATRSTKAALEGRMSDLSEGIGRVWLKQELYFTS